MTPRKRAGASARAAARRKRAPRSKSASPKSKPRPIRQAPPPREADPLAKRTGARLSYFTPEFLAEAKRRVEQTSQSTTAIAGNFGMHHSVLSRLIAREGWVRPDSSGRRRGLSGVMRLAAAADELEVASREVAPHPPSLRFGGQAPQPAIASATAGDTATLSRLEAAVLKELSVVEAMRASLRDEPLRPMDAERTARTLSVLTETLAKLRRLRLGSAPQSGSDHDDYPADIDEFRRDFARRIDLFVASRTQQPGVGGAGPAELRDPV